MPVCYRQINLSPTVAAVGARRAVASKPVELTSGHPAAYAASTDRATMREISPQPQSNGRGSALLLPQKFKDFSKTPNDFYAGRITKSVM